MADIYPSHTMYILSIEISIPIEKSIPDQRDTYRAIDNWILNKKYDLKCRSDKSNKVRPMSIQRVEVIHAGRTS